MNILYITTIGETMRFFTTLIRKLLDEGHSVSIATNESVRRVPDCYREWGCEVYSLPCSRSPLRKGNLSAVHQIRKIVSEKHYDIVHCHTPVAAMCTRLACRNVRKHGTKVFYTAHGFHFFKGAPLKNWLMYYPVEKLCAYYTDVLITINREDYALAQRKMKAKKICYVPGVGIDTGKFAAAQAVRNEKRKAIRKELGIAMDAVMLLSVGELNENKNHEAVLRAVAALKDRRIYYVIAGTGHLKEHLNTLAQELKLEDRILLLGYRHDVPDLYLAADAFIHPSFREGLPVSLMEAMASGTPCIASRIRGNEDLIAQNVSGILCQPTAESITDALREELEYPEKYHACAEAAQQRMKSFDLATICSQIKMIYASIQE